MPVRRTALKKLLPQKCDMEMQYARLCVQMSKCPDDAASVQMSKQCQNSLTTLTTFIADVNKEVAEYDILSNDTAKLP